MGANRAWRVVAAVAAVVVGGLAAAAWGQCEPEWLSGPDQGVAGVDGTVLAMTRWDPDGDGPVGEWLVIGGRFTIAGDTAANNIVAWDGERFHRLGDGLEEVGDFGIRALTVYNGELVAGGQIYAVGGQQAPGIAVWDGVSWRALRSPSQQTSFIGGYVNALTVYDDALIAGGLFGSIERVAGTVNIARWDGSSWSGLDGGLSGEVGALTVRDGALVVGGAFAHLQNLPGVTGVALWNGEAWTALAGDRSISTVRSFIDFQGALIAGTVYGAFRWNGQDWEPFGNGWHGRPAYDLLVYEGDLMTTGNNLMILRNGTWEVFGNTASGQFWPVYALGSLGGEVIVGGSFTRARGVETRGLIRYSPVNGGAWIPFGSGFSAGIRTAGLVAGELVVAGPFQRVGDVSAPGLARWDGRVWHAVAPEEAPITAYAIAEHGDQLYAGGMRDPHTSSASASLVRLDNDVWRTVLSSTGGSVNRLLRAGDDLIVAGEFALAGGSAPNVALVDQAHMVHPMGHGLNGEVTAVGMYRGEVVAAGQFTASGDLPVNNIASWDGQAWRPLGDFPGGTVRALAVHNGELIAAGRLSIEGGGPTLAAAWDGAAWRLMAGGSYGEYITDLAIFDGRLLSIRSRDPYGPLQNRVVAEWNGSDWIFLPHQPSDRVSDLQVFNGELIAVGNFTQVGDIGSAYWARYGSPPSPLCPADADCDGVLTAMDVAAYVQFWFARDARAERTGDAPVAIDVFDLLSYLEEWFGGC